MTARRPMLFALVLAVAAVSFFLTVAVRAKPARPEPPDAVLDWLKVPADQRPEIRSHDPNFPADLARLRMDLASRRLELAAALEKTDTPDPEIRQRSEAVIAAHNAVERRVTDHLLSIRHHLTADQQKRLFDLCAEGVRQGCGWRWRCGQAGTTQPGGGGGPGQGQGRGWRGGR